MVSLIWKTDIAASAEEVFSLLVELRDYEIWLPRSSAYHGTMQISDGPIREGTTYTEPGPFGTRFGRITAMQRPIQLDFEQPMMMKPQFLGKLGIRLFHRITEVDQIVRLTRRLELSFHGPVSLFKPLIVKAFVVENDRMMTALQSFAERGRACRASMR